eukprot:GEZU01005144.1.p1 GENE.GEZU01005144.1~~GEZU01005144.1.p1  ORF type:complete len:197 (-),score=23.48 GEZU01005144.1:98-688(-)
MLRYFVLFCFLFFILANLQAAHADQLDDQQATFSYAKGTRYLPIVIINTRGRSIGQDKVPATIQIIDNPDGINTLWSPPTLVSKINIKIRGHSSRKYPKKQFSIDFLDLFGNQRMVEPFGLPKSDNWAISAPYTDKTLIRNPFAYDLGSAIAKGTMSLEPNYYSVTTCTTCCFHSRIDADDALLSWDNELFLRHPL